MVVKIQLLSLFGALLCISLAYSVPYSDVADTTLTQVHLVSVNVVGV